MIENKIDARYSVTTMGDRQPERYAHSVAVLRERGERVASVLIAPRKYLLSSASANLFDRVVEYEKLLPLLDGNDQSIVKAAIDQAARPYEPIANLLTGEFFLACRQLIQESFSDLKMKREPNGDGVRPADSRTVYFDVRRTLICHPCIPVPRMSLQCWDSAAPAASIKIMIGRWGPFRKTIRYDQSLGEEGAYLRAAGQSLGIVIDTPRLDTQQPVAGQVDAVVEALEAALRLRLWWNTHFDVLNEWRRAVEECRGG